MSSAAKAALDAARNALRSGDLSRQIADLLQSGQIYRELNAYLPQHLTAMPQPPIRMPCDNKKCSFDQAGSDQTFNMTNSYDHNFNAYGSSVSPYLATADKVVKVVYQCAGCHEQTHVFLLQFGPAVCLVGDAPEDRAYFTSGVTKVGQSPAWAYRLTDPELIRILGPHRGLFGKGKACEQESFGIGALAYYRRIVEDRVDSLIDAAGAALTGAERAKYEVAVAEARAEKRVAAKIEIARDALPPNARPGGINPLSVLFNKMSHPLHNETDAQCLIRAEELRDVLVGLLKQLSRADEAKAFERQLRALQDPVGGKGKPAPD